MTKLSASETEIPEDACDPLRNPKDRPGTPRDRWSTPKADQGHPKDND